MKWIIIVVVIILLVVGVVLFRGKLFGKEDGSSASAEMRTSTVRRDNITLSIDATGTIEPLVIVEVSSKASGAITNLAVEEGDTLR